MNETLSWNYNEMVGKPPRARKLELLLIPFYQDKFDNEVVPERKDEYERILDCLFREYKSLTGHTYERRNGHEKKN